MNRWIEIRNQINTPSRIEIWLQALVAVALIAVSVEFLDALDSPACRDGVVADCYPWGARQASGWLWSYRSKPGYLASAFVTLLLLMGAIAMPFLARSRATGIAGLLACLAIALVFNLLLLWALS